MTRTKVMHVVDALRVGGAEKVAVSLANLMPRETHQTYLCSTREEGPFAPLIAPHVERLALFRKNSFEIGAMRQMGRFIREHQIDILHAHSSALFFARAVSLMTPGVKLVWHDHYGRYLFNDRSVPLYRTATAGLGGVIAVNEPLAKWSRESLKIPAHKVWYVANPVELPDDVSPAADMPGYTGKRIVCVANIRPQKDHFNLLSAMTLVKEREPQAHLLLVGDFADAAYKDSVVSKIDELKLNANVSYLGRRDDVAAVLTSCDIGVLSSLSEGLPISLLEYGASRLASVATDVGECGEILGRGSAGLVVPPSNAPALADAILRLLASPVERTHLGEGLYQRVASSYGAPTVVGKIGQIYEQVLADPAHKKRLRASEEVRRYSV